MIIYITETKGLLSRINSLALGALGVDEKASVGGASESSEAESKSANSDESAYAKLAIC